MHYALCAANSVRLKPQSVALNLSSDASGDVMNAFKVSPRKLEHETNYVGFTFTKTNFKRNGVGMNTLRASLFKAFKCASDFMFCLRVIALLWTLQ